MRISLLVPCYNEEKSVESCILSCLNQTRPFDQLIFVDDSSKDNTPTILKKYKNRITAIKTPCNTGNKSSAQEFGLQYITGDIFITTDGDTVLDKNFVAEIEKSFQDNNISAVAGYVRSLPYNWLTLCRAFDYVMGQSIHKLAEHYTKCIFVMPGACSAFYTKDFKKYITFDHDTITEDLDFTYKLHQQKLKISFNQKAISYTQDPTDLKNYINQMRRWFGGGWQNLAKHYRTIPDSPMRSFEITLLYAEGIIFSALLFVVPILNWWFGFLFLIGYFVITFLFAIWAAWKEKRPSLILVPFPYIILFFINAYIYLEQFIKEIILKKKNLVWFKPERVKIDINN
jgi:cellulose synthase/poly-beta-1,6-N-acetylglucosamine synthase-like glycosyltransferase